jgi:hypothetical protein
MGHKNFDKIKISDVFLSIENLKKNFDEVERDCGLINKREALLNVKKTEFGVLYKV